MQWLWSASGNGKLRLAYVIENFSTRIEITPTVLLGAKVRIAPALRFCGGTAQFAGEGGAGCTEALADDISAGVRPARSAQTAYGVLVDSYVAGRGVA